MLAPRPSGRGQATTTRLHALARARPPGLAIARPMRQNLLLRESEATPPPHGQSHTRPPGPCASRSVAHQRIANYKIDRIVNCTTRDTDHAVCQKRESALPQWSKDSLLELGTAPHCYSVFYYCLSFVRSTDLWGAFSQCGRVRWTLCWRPSVVPGLKDTQIRFSVHSLW
jgi:hypothetical protein